ncbi:MAG: aspartate kinase [Planctomycetota bacterium]|nr:aspartate kinase [Planctomycetota bacterium]
MKSAKRQPTRTISVHKFGGAALANAQAIESVVELITHTSGMRIIVTSALAGVTDVLLSVARAAASGDLVLAHTDARLLHERHLRVIELIDPSDAPLRQYIDESFAQLAELLVSVAHEKTLSARMSDAIISRGERIAAQIVACALRATGVCAAVVDAADFLQTDGRFGDAAPDLVRTEIFCAPLFSPILARGEIVVVPGFIGAGKENSVVTLGRGGSDLTATVIARVLAATEVTLWKDVRGFLTADPRIVPEARIVAQLDPREASELAYYGAKVLHPRALIPLTLGTTLRIRPFADPDAVGTEIAYGRSVAGSPVRALSAIHAQALVTVAGNGMLGVPGIAARTFGALANSNISVSLISQASSEHSICFTVPEHAAAAAETQLRAAFAAELERDEIDSVEVMMGVATVAVVGVGMARTPGTAARVLGSIADAQVNVIAIAQGSSERNISFVVNTESVPRALRAIHAAFRLDKVGGGRTVRRHGADVILLGCGRIGRELLEQIAALPLQERSVMRIVAVIDTSGFIFQSRGLSQTRLASIAASKKRGGSLKELSGSHVGSPIDAVRHLAAHALTRPVLVDVSSGDTRESLLSAIANGIDLVIANKVPLALDSASARAILRDARTNGRQILHEATVGAGLPIIDTAEKLIASGDRILSILACPSGTMGYIFSELGRGRKFSDALRGAMKLGYTEPDPREDLSGCDVARKAIILGRMLGYEGELSNIAVESLVPTALREVSLKDFIAQLRTLDDAWAARVEAANAKGDVLRYCASVTRASVRVGLLSVPRSSSLGSLSGTDNQFVFTTTRYRENSLIISGPGAGPAVTAAGVLNDLLRVVAS